jgi:hypothetical protein
MRIIHHYHSFTPETKRVTGHVVITREGQCMRPRDGVTARCAVNSEKSAPAAVRTQILRDSLGCLCLRVRVRLAHVLQVQRKARSPDHALVTIKAIGNVAPLPHDF